MRVQQIGNVNIAQVDAERDSVRVHTDVCWTSMHGNNFIEEVGNSVAGIMMTTTLSIEGHGVIILSIDKEQAPDEELEKIARSFTRALQTAVADWGKDGFDRALYTETFEPLKVENDAHDLRDQLAGTHSLHT